MEKLFKFVILIYLLSQYSLSFSQSVETFDGLAKIPLDIYKSREPNSPTIVYAHGCSGYDKYDIQKARLMRDWGFNVVVAEYTRGRGLANKTGPKGSNITCEQGYISYPMLQRSDDLMVVGKWVLQQEWHKGRIGAIGFSLGGGAVEYLINNTKEINPFSAGISFYPYCRYQLLTDEKTLPNQFHIGTLDEGYERCIFLNRTESRHNIFTYENATHAFDNNWTHINRNGYTYDKESTRIAFERVKVFFNTELRK